MVDQVLINWVFGSFGAVLLFLLKSIWQAVTDLQRGKGDLIDRIQKVETIAADKYVKQEEFDRFTSAVFRKLDRIEDKLDGKEDKT